jgi:hypothetical protein
LTWQASRAGGPAYYYRSTRRNGQVVKQYVGVGPEAEAAAAADAERRAARDARRAADRAERVRVDAALDLLRDARRWADTLIAAWAAARGFREHRGQYRRKRGPMIAELLPPAPAAPAARDRATPVPPARPTPVPPARPAKSPRPQPPARGTAATASPPALPSHAAPTPVPVAPVAPAPEAPTEASRPLALDPNDPAAQQAAFRELVRRANTGRPEAVANLRKLLDIRPEIWQAAGDLTALAGRAWADVIADRDALVAESARRTADQLAADLAGSTSDPLERLLADQVAVTWLATRYAELVAAAPGFNGSPGAAYRLKQAESAGKRHIAAAKALAVVRALAARRGPAVSPS